MRALAFLLVTFWSASPAPANAHDHAQETTVIPGKADRRAEPRSMPEGSPADEEPHPEITAVVERAGPCFEFRVRASRGNDGSETKHIERCD